MLGFRLRHSLMLAVVLFTLTAQAVTLRVMLHPQFANGATAAQLERLGGQVGRDFWPQGVTRTGAYEIDLPGMSASQASQVLTQLRRDSVVLWAEVALAKPMRKSALAGKEPTQQLVIKLADDQLQQLLSPEARADRLRRLAGAIGKPLTLDRELTGGAWMVRLDAPMTTQHVALLAERLEQESDVQYADPVMRVHLLAAPNDALFNYQWNLTNPVSGINALSAWKTSTGAGTTVGVIDTGVLPDHPDLTGKFQPGYCMISDPVAANGGNCRGPDPFDWGDWTQGGECGSPDANFFEGSSWHGSHVSGIIAANTNNLQGIAGVSFGARLLPVRALGVCGGIDVDLADAILWAAGLPVLGAPLNPNPAQVLNLSLGGSGSCSGYVQQAIDAAIARGVTIVVAAGNGSTDVAFDHPANCNGVIAVAANNISGDRAYYSNYGSLTKITAPGGEFWSTEGIFSTISAGPFTALDYSYTEYQGTSMAAPHVAGVVSLVLSANPGLTPGQILNILQQSARPFPNGSRCTSKLSLASSSASGLFYCGAGLLDAAAALSVASVYVAPVMSGKVTVSEFFNSISKDYFITSNGSEIQAINQGIAGPGWLSTGETFLAYVLGSTTPTGTVPVCRFVGNVPSGLAAHFYTADSLECSVVARASGWRYEGLIFNVAPLQSGTCAAGTQALYRLFNGGPAGSIHRYTISASIYAQMTASGWVGEGAVMCVPDS